ncbi:MAG: uroporphyrinogen decarboxylase family protein [Candidatus Zipacnadales bacterium]
MTHRERFIECALGKPVDRPPFWLFWSPWSRTWARWEKEGKPPEVSDHRSFMQPDSPPATLPVNLGPCPPLPRQVLEEDEDYIVHTDSWGIVRRDYKHGESMAQFLKFPVADWDDWRRFKDERLDPNHPARLAGPWREQGQQWMAAGVPIQLGYFPDCTVFGAVRWLLGDEEGLLAFYTDPELVHEIMGQMTDIFITVFNEVAKHVRVDVIHIWEDMCGRQGPLISPHHWQEFIGPCYRRIKEFAVDHDIPLLSVDTDGKPDDIVPPMMEAGVNYLWPNEVAAGCDVNDYRRRFPELALMGGIDKRALAQGPEAIEAELDRIWPAVKLGRYIPDLDHLVPDDVSWPNYYHYCVSLKQRVYAMAKG